MAAERSALGLLSTCICRRNSRSTIGGYHSYNDAYVCVCVILLVKVI